MCEMLSDIMQLMCKKMYMVVLISVLILYSITYVISYYYRVPPCSLCNLERALLLAFGLTSLCGLMLKQHIIHVMIDIVNVMISCIGIALATRQLWLQWHPLANDAGFCDASFKYLLTVMTVPEALWHVMKGGSSCVNSKWHLWHIGLASSALVLFTVCFILSGWHLVHTLRQHQTATKTKTA